MVQTLAEQLVAVQRAGVVMLLAEQHAGLVGELASRVYVLERGAVGYREWPDYRGYRPLGASMRKDALYDMFHLCHH
jgi:hypothetical protein